MKNIIFLVNITNPVKPGRTKGYDLSIESWSRWAEKHGCEVLTLTEPVVDISEMTPIIQRHYIFDLLEGSNVDFDQVCMVDADTIVHPDCPDFFDLTNREFSAVHNDGDYDWVIRSLENYAVEFERPSITIDNVWRYFNAGFIVTNEDFRFLHDQVIGFYWENQSKIQSMQQKYGVGTDQPLMNMIVNGYDESDLKVNLLPYKFNMQDLARKNVLDDRMLFTTIPGVYHFNAVPGGPEVVHQWLQKTFNHLWKN